MPQMAPIWWTILFITFNVSFIMLLINMYFQVNLIPLSNMKTNKMNKVLNWKW